MATAKPKTTKIEAPIEEATLEEVVLAEAVEEALIEDVIEEVVEAVIEELPVEEPVAVEVILDTPQASVEEVTPQVVPSANQPIWYGAMTGQIHKQRNQ